jgi:membrane associated rhomboid family serine protease
MLDDRPYMRSDYRPPGNPMRLNLSVTNILLVSLVVAFFAQYARPGPYQDWVLDHFALSIQGLRHGYIWQLLTFQFMHAGLSHLVCNGVGLWSFGRFVEARLGKARFLTLYLLSGVFGGLVQCAAGLILPGLFGAVTVGASAGIFGLIAAFATLYPDETVRLFFLIPIQARYFIHLSIVFTLVCMVIPSQMEVANAAHLGGILFGMFYIRRGLSWTGGRMDWNFFRRKSSRAPAPLRAGSGAFKPRRTKAAENPELPSEEFISQEVDPILDKISAHGIQSLTERERQILQAARSKMSKR